MYNSQDHTAMFFKSAHKFELSNEYEATPMPDTRDQRVLSILDMLTHASIAIIDIHTGFTIGNVHKSMRYALKFTISM